MVLFYSFLLGGTTIPHRPGHAPDNAKVSNLNQKWVHPRKHNQQRAQRVGSDSEKGIYLSRETYIPFIRNIYTFHAKGI